MIDSFVAIAVFSAAGVLGSSGGDGESRLKRSAKEEAL